MKEDEDPASGGSTLLGSLSVDERRFVLQQRSIQMLNSFMHIISTTAHYQSYLEQVYIYSLSVGLPLTKQRTPTKATPHDRSDIGHLLTQVNGNVARLAVHYGRTMSINNACNTFLAPVVGSMSDACGRRTLHWMGRAGAAIFFML